MSTFGFDDYDEGGSYPQEVDLDLSGGSRQDWSRTSKSTDLAFEKRDLYDQSLESNLMKEVRKVIDTYNFGHDRVAKKIEEEILIHDSALKLSNPGLIVTATIFLLEYGNKGLTRKNFTKFSSDERNRHKTKNLDLVRYIKFLSTLGVGMGMGI